MAKDKKSVAGDNALREFYQSCRLSPATTEGAIKARYEVSTTIADRDEAVANVNVYEFSRADCRTWRTSRSISTKAGPSSSNRVTN